VKAGLLNRNGQAGVANAQTKSTSFDRKQKLFSIQFKIETIFLFEFYEYGFY
jgi:hypothetical protein